MGRPGRPRGDLVTDSGTPTPDFAAAQQRMRHVPEPVEPDAPLPAGESGAAYPVNEQHLEDFQVGGVERSLPPEEQLAQIVSYMENSYPVPNGADADENADAEAADRYLAALPDRLTHAAMLMLGSGLDHTMPGVAYGMDVEVHDLPELGARVFTPSSGAGDRWAVALNPGFGPRATEHHWRPLVAALAELSGTAIVDAPGDALAAARDVIAQQPATTCAIIAEQHSAEDPAGTAHIDAAPLLAPSPGYATAAIGDESAENIGVIATPEEYRRIVRDLADQLRATGS